MENRVYNFSAGPAVLPEEVLREARDNILNYQGTGLGIMEMSHRSKPFEAIITRARQQVQDLLGIKDDYEVLFLAGGASLQFYMAPLNLLSKDDTADYIITGAWSELALKEAQRVAPIHVAASSKDAQFTRIPGQQELAFSGKARYVHITTNNTIFGTEWQKEPDTGGVPLVADASSDIMSRPIDMRRYGLIYAGAQKNIGPAGVTMVIIRKDILTKTQQQLPTMLDYKVHAKQGSLFNTPPVFAIYVVSLVLQWLIDQGGLSAIQKANEKKAQLVYDAIDASKIFRGTAQKDSRSLMNVTFRLPSEELESVFINEATAAGLNGLKGHRSVGGMRASIYNAFPLKGVQRLVDFMREFEKKNT